MAICSGTVMRWGQGPGEGSVAGDARGTANVWPLQGGAGFPTGGPRRTRASPPPTLTLTPSDPRKTSRAIQPTVFPERNLRMQSLRCFWTPTMGALLDALVIRGRLTTRHYGDGPWAVDVLEDDADGVNVHGHVADDGATGGEGYREGEWVGGPHPCPWILGGKVGVSHPPAEGGRDAPICRRRKAKVWWSWPVPLPLQGRFLQPSPLPSHRLDPAIPSRATVTSGGRVSMLRERALR